MANTTHPGHREERRERIRFPLRLDAECAFRKHRAPRAFPTKRHGQVVNISTGGCCLVLADPAYIEVGMTAFVRIDWPAQLSGRTALQLHVWGRVIRTDADEVAVEFQRYEFRLKGKSRAAPVRDSGFAGSSLERGPEMLN